MDLTFDVIEYLSGLTGYTFDKAVLKRVAFERDLARVTDFAEIDNRTKLLCTKDLLVTMLRAPWSSGSYTVKHGDFTEQYGQQTITANNLEEIKAQIRQINRELELEEDDGIPQAAPNEWVNEDQWDF